MPGPASSRSCLKLSAMHTEKSATTASTCRIIVATFCAESIPRVLSSAAIRRPSCEPPLFPKDPQAMVAKWKPCRVSSEDATAYPLTKGFFTKVPRLPSSEGNQTINGLEKKAYEWNASSVDCKVTESGGDAETRPTNISVDVDQV